jgi:hypothetical protein
MSQHKSLAGSLPRQLQNQIKMVHIRCRAQALRRRIKGLLSMQPVGLFFRKSFVGVVNFVELPTAMKKQKYPVEADNEKHLYEFFSEGPMGKIRKVILYEKIGGNFFNLGFGDWNEELQQADDSSRSNNGDRDKVLATVAFTALDFTNQFPSARIVAQGSTSARTRLYQMGIADNLLEINRNFEIYGLFEGEWDPFKKGRNYEAFLIRRK